LAVTYTNCTDLAARTATTTTSSNNHSLVSAPARLSFLSNSPALAEQSEPPTMSIVLISTLAAFFVLCGVFLGAFWGVRVGRREGLAAARATTQEHWVDLLEVSVNLQQARRENGLPSNDLA
jgi:hypothetical protein